jgi:hypothetical protein
VGTVERADYLEAVQRNSWTFPAVDGCPDPPPDWVAAAWDTEAVQRSIAHDMARDVSKNGELFCGQEFLEALSASLSTGQVVRLFHTIRDGSPHREEEFRSQFERGFARHVAALPPPLTRQEVAAALGKFGFDEATAAELMGEEPPDDESRL